RLGALCDDISAAGTPVEMANLNCPGQIVVSGSREGIDAVVERGKEAGAKRVIPLEVSGPFHSAMMKPAAERLGEALRAIEMQDARIPVIANVTARPVTEAEQIRGLLVEQVFSPVLWEDSVRYLIDQGVDTFVEIGSGKVLSGLIKKIDRSARIVSINSLEAIEAYE
ncbi:ACP S-malonyltransferase, partial [Bacillus cereus]|nr:ACP S-malonyltransferase [Bacillus cereus]